MGRYTTNKGITWSDDDGGFQAEDILKLAQAYQQNKLAEAANTRANAELAMRQDEYAYNKNLDANILKGKQIYDETMIGMTSSGWNAEGVWDAPPVNPRERALSYIARMKELGIHGNGIEVYNQLQALNVNKLSEDGRILQFKVNQWETANQGRHGKWYIPGDDTFQKDKMAYIKNIGGERLFRQAFALGGLPDQPADVNAATITGLSSKDFAPSDDWSTAKLVAGGGAALTGLAMAKKGKFKPLMKALNLFKSNPDEAIKSIKLLNAAPGDNPYKGVLDKIIKLRAEGKNAEASRLVNRFKDRLPTFAVPKPPKGMKWDPKLGKNIPVSKSILEKAKNAFSLEGMGTKSKNILKTGGKVGAFGLANQLASNLGESVGGEKGAKVAEIATGVGSTALFDKAFWKWSAGKLKGNLAKRAAVAGAASLADGPLPIADAISAFVIAGFTISDIIQLTSEWENLSNK